jgi:hypothetical protein
VISGSNNAVVHFRTEEQIGMEITHIDDGNRPWILSLTEPNHSASFIPRTSFTARTFARSAPL